ncbi:hypothetical protein GQ53DRAFT_886052 [Thozetella sp. PMI_491]|nr:hypothetical protein GQ53DRAFT_886052 [Thozetella sp. PMI_491]
MLFKATACLLSAIALGDAAAMGRVAARDTTQVYAYGTDIPGLPLYAGSDGLAYISNSSDVTGLAALTWSIDSTGERPWNATNTNSTMASLYMITASDSFAQVGFLNSSTTAPSSAVTKGFVTYGSYIMYLDGDTYVSEFWAQTTDSTGVWALMWNQNGTAQVDSVPVSLKTQALITS